MDAPSKTPPAPVKPGFQGFLSTLGLVAFGLLMGLVAGEILLRIVVPIEPVFVEWDPVLGVRHRAGMKGTWYRETTRPVRVELNSLGFRNGPMTREKAPGTVRVLMLGDSYLEGMQVPFDELVSERLRARLQAALPDERIEVLNGGVAGWGQSEQSLYLAQRGWQYAPDLVVSFLYLGNDLSDNWYKTGSPVRPSYEMRGDSLVLHPPHLSPMKVFVRDRVLAHLAIPKFVRMYMIHRYEWARLWAVKQGLILRNVRKAHSGEEANEVLEIAQHLYARMQDDCARHHVPFLAFQFPYGLELMSYFPDTTYAPAKVRNAAESASAPYVYQGAQMKAFFERAPIAHIVADSAFAAAVSKGDTLYIQFDGHWTSRGHEVAADLIARRILAQGWLTHPAAASSAPAPGAR